MTTLVKIILLAAIALACNSRTSTVYPISDRMIIERTRDLVWDINFKKKVARQKKVNEYIDLSFVNLMKSLRWQQKGDNDSADKYSAICKRYTRMAETLLNDRK